MIVILIGLAAGIISGMGIGGGAILIPALVIFVKPEQHIAQSVNLLFFIPTAIVALVIHIKNKNVNFRMGIPIVISGLGGAVLGSTLALSMNGATLKHIFGIFLLLMGLYEIFGKGKGKKGNKAL
ncbi:sulfite exporter TauE/SafE family protein [Ruminiclostridium papyrosolvens]|uniref:Probable membrane transporter protein n=1 Tax=Ruminiclostridium papyrosolvens C7 TaxID=1330534 RepID=U4R2F3_9FIRM|nr:sulfite exporter TauE/SafE family protein [Ruminiclostridium papyrosolvens]EPR11870.1 permease [Ruminiclostridium papyrosolvens C7]